MTTIPFPKPTSLPELPQQDTIETVTQEIAEEINKDPLPQETITQDMINMNHEQRLQQIESILLRIRGSI